MKRINFILALACILFFACEEKEDEPAPHNPPSNKITANPGVSHQEMIGFGAALTWWSDRVISSPHTKQIYDLMFADLGMDILRLKNWYYPQNYPANKDPQNMVTNGDRVMFEATNEFYAKAKEYNPDIKILLSSWGPPAELKSNNHLRQGTLKKDGDRFMYEEFGQYWVDILDHISFKPDYISIQNEPGYINPGWTTCMWSPTETATTAGFDKAIDEVYERIKDRPDAPLIMGPETENAIAFNNFMPFLENKDYMPIYAYHPYNFNEGSPFTQIDPFLQEIKSRFGSKPNIMTEYSNMSWFKTARFIHRNLTLANTSGYIYWELVWGDVNRKDYPMINIDGAGNYEVTGFYHLMKHFAKYIDYGYKRIDVTSSLQTVEVSAYSNPEGDRVTFVAINTDPRELQFLVEVKDKKVKTIEAYQSVEGDYYKKIQNLKPESTVRLKRSSITTIVVGLED